MHTNDPTAAHSGRVLVRMPRELHDELSHLAARQGVSVNQLAVALLAAGAAWRTDRSQAPAPSGA